MERRRVRRRRVRIALGILFLIAVGAIVYGLQRPGVRISNVEVYGADPALTSVVYEALEGYYAGILPRNSIIFFPESRIRSRLLVADSDIATVSIFRKGFTGLSIKVVNRVPIAQWCGEAYTSSASPVSTTTPRADCYVFDDSGFLFATTTSQPLVNSFVFYAPLQEAVGRVGARLPNISELPSVFNFAREVGTFGSPAEAVVLNQGEVTLYLTSGTRITYVLGHEQEAYTALISARDNFNLMNGSIEYVDLRFGEKVYIKRGNVSVPE